ncbi:MAG: saccharopine dehydrogenase NADP-binding domain-containing protein [Calditrichaeota bacterium]|nr:saccharopine dehydrogenase NADP-binding domain-containing protein [Calditrichota bacterium]MCB9369344.1 saccharopine dehydrogenase NADP-binding domain-containing protein [Calditrichota bacterium]
MHPEILILGAGLMGRVAAHFFVHHPDGPYKIRLADLSRGAVDEAVEWLNSDLVESTTVDVRRDDSLEKVLTGIKVCQSCVPYFLNPMIARACLANGVSFVDLGGNPEVTDKILSQDAEAKAKGVSLIPDTGLAPGLTNILAMELVRRFEKCDDVHVRVGGLPLEPIGRLKYAQFFSIHGLLNEYLEDAREIRDGKEVLVKSLDEVERLDFEGVGELEAFITSGGTSTLTRTLLGKVQRLDYKTIRYPGHANYLQFLREIGLTSKREFLFGGNTVSPREVLTHALDESLQKNVPDRVLVRVWATGDGGREESLELNVLRDDVNGISAMGQMTSFPSAAITRAIYMGQIPAGAHPQETVMSFETMKSELELRWIGFRK